MNREKYTACKSWNNKLSESSTHFYEDCCGHKHRNYDMALKCLHKMQEIDINYLNGRVVELSECLI